MGRGAQLGIAAALLAEKSRGTILNDKERMNCSVFIGTSVGGLDFAEKEFRKFFKFGASKVSPYSGIAVFCASASAEISRYLSLNGASISISNGCTSSIDALAYAFEQIQLGKSEIAISGGADCCVTPGIIAAFSRMGVISTGYNSRSSIASRPFDKDRDGFVVGEGAWIFILEEYTKAKASNKKIFAELKGFGTSCDAFHPTTPHPGGQYSTLAIKSAIENSKLTTNQIDYIVAYGNATRLNDKYETMVIKEVFGKRAYQIPISSIKSMIGHSIGSSGAAQVAAAISAMNNDFIPPTAGLDNPDEGCDLDYVPNQSRFAQINNVLCNTLSFGGKNAAIVLSKAAL
jgi:3-oxoacyl-[acyl-carrier-protein] synthase II